MIISLRIDEVAAARRPARVVTLEAGGKYKKRVEIDTSSQIGQPPAVVTRAGARQGQGERCPGG